MNKKAIGILMLMYSVSNQAIGDALADALLVEAALYGLKWDIKKWNAICIDRPSCLTKLKVKDRTAFKTTNAEQVCVEPKGLQDEINKICGKYKDAISFVRPSGTEDCVRIYTEATTQQDADQINLLVQRAVYDIAAGLLVLSIFLFNKSTVIQCSHNFAARPEKYIVLVYSAI